MNICKRLKQHNLLYHCMLLPSATTNIWHISPSWVMQFTTTLSTRAPSTQNTGTQFRSHCHPPSSVLSYWCSYWNWAQTSANITDEWRQTVPYDSNYCRRGNRNFLILWQGINSHLCWKCGPMLRCGPAMFWCWGSCGAPLVSPSSCQRCSSSTEKQSDKRRQSQR